MAIIGSKRMKRKRWPEMREMHRINKKKEMKMKRSKSENQEKVMKQEKKETLKGGKKRIRLIMKEEKKTSCWRTRRMKER